MKLMEIPIVQAWVLIARYRRRAEKRLRYQALFHLRAYDCSAPVQNGCRG